MEVGTLKQKASNTLVFFVFVCICVTVGLLYVMQKSEALAQELSFSGEYEVISY